MSSSGLNLENHLIPSPVEINGSSSGLNLENYLIPLEEINRATENFSQQRFIGSGGFGKVYWGQLSDQWNNCIVAIKRLGRDSFQGVQEFRNELKIISSFHHENIIAFIGYCDQENEMIIVYEYASKGSLDQHIGNPERIGRITWAQRLEICIGAARGLNHLHSGVEEQRTVIHRDVKSANILLDDNMIPKICDFGLSKLGDEKQAYTSVHTKVAGTRFYLDPNYQESRILRKDSDVYSFGVVLFEILSGLLAHCERRIGNEQQILMQSVRLYHEVKQETIIDPNMRDQIQVRSFHTFRELAYQCISHNSKERPTLDTVIKKLEEALIHQTSSAPVERSEIESILRQLNSVDPYKQQTAAINICVFTNSNAHNRVAFGTYRIINLLTPLLTARDSLTQQYTVTALLNLSADDDNKSRIMDKALSGLIHVLREGSVVSREKAAATLLSLAVTDEYKRKLGFEGAIPPLLSLFRKGDQRRLKAAMIEFFNLCAYDGNNGRAMRAGLIPFLIELLNEPQGEMKDVALDTLLSLSRHQDGRLNIGKAKALPLLVEIIESGSPKNKKNAIDVLLVLFSADHTYILEAKERGLIAKLKDLPSHNTDTWLRECEDSLRKVLLPFTK